MTTGAKLGWAFAAVAASTLLAAISFGTYWVANFVSGNKLAQQGYEAVALGDHDVAIEKLTAALQKTLPAYPRAYVYLNRGVAYNHKQQFDAAIRDFSEALRLNSGLSDAYAGRGWAYQQKHEFDKALVDVTDAIKRDPNSKWAYYTRGLIFFEREQWDLALADLNEAVRCWPDNAEPLFARGLTYSRKGDLERALASFDGAILIDPKNSRAFFERANIYERKGEAEKGSHDRAEATRLMDYNIGAGVTQLAERYNPLQPTMQLNPKPLDVTPLPSVIPKLSARQAKSYQHVMAEQDIALATRDYDRAIALSNEALIMEITPAQASNAVMRRGEAYFRQSNLDKAARDFDQAITLDSKNGMPHVFQAWILQQQGKRDAAIKQCDAAVQVRGSKPLGFLTRAEIFREEGDVAAALGDLTSALNRDPGYVDAYIARAGIYLQENDPDNAIANCDRAIELEPDSVRAHIRRASAYATQAKLDEARRDFELAIATKNIKPGELEITLNSTAWFHATCPLDTLRDGKKAIEEATKACELSRWQLYSFIDTLAAAHAQAGRFSDAIKYEKQALGMMPGRADRERMEKRLVLYQQHKPYRE